MKIQLSIIMWLLLLILWILIVYIVSLLNSKTKKLDIEIEAIDWDLNIKKYSIERSRDILEFMRYLVGITAVIEFKKLTDNYRLEAINRPMIQKLITDIANICYDSIENSNEYVMNELLLSKDFIMQHLIDITETIVKKLLDDAITEVE